MLAATENRLKTLLQSKRKKALPYGKLEMKNEQFFFTQFIRHTMQTENCRYVTSITVNNQKIIYMYVFQLKAYQECVCLCLG